ncbi:MAG: alpha/beta fold hydrolase [Alphaproteobacteria bacterium]|nr:alpha/beta fold hydrolase [Alphaproteobacteria bacterium]
MAPPPPAPVVDPEIDPNEDPAAGPGAAPEAPGDEDEDTIVVTGSRLPSDPADSEARSRVAECLILETCIGVDILFGSNREILFGEETETFNRFGRSPETPFKSTNAGELTLGEIFVTVPTKRDAGVISRPPEVMGRRIGFRLDPQKHFVFVDYGPLSRDAFGGRIDAADSAFLFVHGFNVSFKSAAMRAAQLKVDGGYDGQAMIFSWPTQHYDPSPTSPLPRDAYEASRREAEAARAQFREFLDLIVARTDSRKVHIIAHSMGNYMMMETLAALRDAAGSDGAPVFGEIIFAAPDVDRDEFSALARRIDGLGSGMTLYASSKDFSMEVSRKLCELRVGAPCPPRAGDAPAGEGPIVLSGLGIDTIDASNLPNRFFLPTDEHDYFGGDIQIIRDIAALMRTRQRAPRTLTLNAADAGAGRYWIFPCAAGYSC